jgi:GNAT superfamily N-acetyltransferase
MHSEPLIERLSESNLDDMKRLYRAVYGPSQQVPDFRKKYATDWAGACYIAYLAYDPASQPIAYYGVLPCIIQYGEVSVLSAQSGDTMTHPDHRGKGLFALLSKKTFELCRQEGIRLLFGFPNQNSLPGTGKLGWSLTHRLNCFTIPVRTLSLPGLVRRFPFLSGLYAGYAGAILKKVLAPQRVMASSIPVESSGGIRRDAAWFDYKTYSHTPVIRLGTANIWVKSEDSFIIGDIEPGDQDLGETMRRLKRLAAILGHRRLFFHSSPGTPLHDWLARTYPSVTSFHALFIDLGAGIPLDQLKFTSSDFDTF